MESAIKADKESNKKIMDNHDEKQNHSMMWMMVICGVLPFAIVLFGRTALFSGGYLWPILVGGLVFACIWMMFRGHGHGSSGEEHHDMTNTKQTSPENVPRTDEKKGHSGHSCCH